MFTRWYPALILAPNAPRNITIRFVVRRYPYYDLTADREFKTLPFALQLTDFFAQVF